MLKDEIVELMQKMISIKSPYYNESEIVEYTDAWLKTNGFDSHIHTYEEPVSGFKGNNVVCIIDSGREGPTICLNGHLDTVYPTSGWEHDQYGSDIAGDKMYGIGALDMKSGCCSIMLAAREFFKTTPSFKGKIIITLVSVEEGPFGLGTNALIDEGLLDGVDCSIITEPSAGFCHTPFPTLCLGAKGNVVYQVEFWGKASHAATPEYGVNAAKDASIFICNTDKVKFKKDPILGEGRICPILIAADGGACSVPEYAKVVVQRHIVTGETIESVLEETEELLESLDIQSKYKVSMREAPSEGSQNYEPYVVPEHNPYAKVMIEAIRKESGKLPTMGIMNSIGDFNYLGTRLGNSPAIVFGAAGDRLHQSDEYVHITSIERTVYTLVDFLQKVLK